MLCAILLIFYLKLTYEKKRFMLHSLQETKCAAATASMTYSDVVEATTTRITKKNTVQVRELHQRV